MGWAKKFRRAKSECVSEFQPGHWALAVQKLKAGAVPQLRLALPNQRPCSISCRRGDPCGRPKAFPWGKVPSAARRMRGTVLVMRATRFNRRGAHCAPAGRRGRRPLRLNRNVSAFRRGGCPHPPGLGWLNRRSGTPGPPAAVPGPWSCETPAFTRTAPQNTGTPPRGPRCPPPACPPAAPGATGDRRWAGSGGRCPR